MPKLVIVESPAKAKTIKNYLGKDYEVMSTMGHIRDLPKRSMGINFNNNYEPLYITIDGKEKAVRDLKAVAKKADEVYLATDPDREGEAIARHLAYLFNIDPQLTSRVTFEEITKNGVKKGMDNPRCIDMNLFYAQQARRVLDRIVGYTLSPFLQRKVQRGLSAGRVQSVAVRLIVDREREIEAFKPEEYWHIDAVLYPEGTKKEFSARLRTVEGVAADDFKISDKENCEKIVNELDKETFVISDIKERQRKRSPEPPFITSTLQQDASRRFGFTARRTMNAAQNLYDGVAVEGYGTVGLITYMRTDSTRISAEAHNEAVAYIGQVYGAKYALKTPRAFKSKRAVAAQEAHEAIRPTMVDITPGIASKTLTADQNKIYRLVWERFIASRMTDEIQNTVTVNISAGKYRLRATGSQVLFDGFTKLYEASTDEKKEGSNKLPPMEQSTPLTKKEIKSSQHFTQPPARYTEASLIRALEENGIGRPSTYAQIMSTIEKIYVALDKKAMIPTQMGMIVTDILKQHFGDIVNVAFSADMEKDLDKIAEGKNEYADVIDEFYQEFNSLLKMTEDNLKGKTFKPPEEISEIKCENCGRNMVIKTGKYGKFLACPGYPDCRNTKPVIEKTKGVCPKCGGQIIQRRGKNRKLFYVCEKGKEKCGFISWDEPSAEICPACGSTLFAKKGKNPYLYCAKEGCGFKKDATDEG